MVDLSIETKPNEKRIGKREKKSLKRYLLEKVQAKVERKATFPDLLLPGATELEGSTPFPVCSATRRIGLIEAVLGRWTAKECLHEKQF